MCALTVQLLGGVISQLLCVCVCVWVCVYVRVRVCIITRRGEIITTVHTPDIITHSFTLLKLDREDGVLCGVVKRSGEPLLFQIS